MTFLPAVNVVSVRDVTWAISGAVSNVIDITGHTACGLIFPAAMTNTAVQLWRCDDITPTTGWRIADASGTDYDVTVSVSQYAHLDPRALLGVRFIQLRGASNEVAARSLQLVTVRASTE